MEVVKLGLIGCGICVQQLYWPELKQIPELFKIVAVSGGSTRGMDFAKETGAEKFYTDYRELLRDPEVEAVCIAYPFTMNHEITCAALEAGKHLMVEKPMAASLEEAQDMLERSRTASTVTMVAENFRYRKMIEKVRELMDGGAIGTPYTFIWNLIGFTPRDDQYVAKSKWRLDSYYGLLFDGSVHFISTFRELFGEIKSGIGFTAQSRDDMGTRDTVTYQMVFENGMTGTYHMFQTSVGYTNREAIIFGSHGTIKIRRLSEVTVTTENSEEVYTFENDAGYMAEFVDFYNSIRKGTTPKSTFEQGYRDFLADVVAFAPMSRWDGLKLSDFTKDQQR